MMTIQLELRGTASLLALGAKYQHQLTGTKVHGLHCTAARNQLLGIIASLSKACQKVLPRQRPSISTIIQSLAAYASSCLVPSTALPPRPSLSSLSINACLSLQVLFKISNILPYPFVISRSVYQSQLAKKFPGHLFHSTPIPLRCCIVVPEVY